MITSHRFSQGVTYALLAHLASAILLFASLAIATRSVSKTQLGTFVLVCVAADFLAMIADFGMTSTAVSFLSAERNKREEIASTCLGFSFLVSLAKMRTGLGRASLISNGNR
jgi:O-antigen/teichoic acid export membrane protein